MAAVTRALLLLAALCLPAFSNVPFSVAVKPHPGLADFAPAPHPATAAANALTATGFGRCLCDEGRRSRSTGKERDAETQLDYFGARYLSSAQGRFTSPDAPFADQHAGDPQSWNLYGYVRNNPLKYHDPDGRICIFGIGNTCNQDVPAPPPPPAPRPPVLTPNGQPAQGPQPAPNPAAPGFTLTVNSRQAQIPGGSALSAAGVNHQWITTSTGATVGFGTQQGVPQSDAPLVETFVVDHTGQVAQSSTTYTNLPEGAAMSYLQTGKRVGNWIPGLSDCNTWCNNVVQNSTPQDRITYEYTPYVGWRSRVEKNSVVYSDGSVRKAGGAKK